MSRERKRKNMESKYKDHTGSLTSSMPRWWTDMGNENNGYGGYEYMDPWGQMGLKYAPKYYHNEPGRKHTRSSETSSSGGDTDSNVQNEKPIKGRLQGRKIALIVIVVGLVAIAAAITVILVLTLKPAEGQPNKFRVVTMSLSVAETFKPEYKDPSSSEYKIFAGNFTSAMDEIFQANNTKGYKGIQIVELKNGSVIVIFAVVIEFKQSEGPPGEEVLRAVITGQKAYENDSNSVVVKNFKIRIASVLVVKTEEFVSNPISTTAEPVTTSTTATKATTATSSTSSPSPGPNNFSVATINLSVDETFKPEYNSGSSVEYQSFVAEFANAMDKIFNTTEGYKGIQVKELKNGSVIVIFIIVIEIKQNVKPLGEQELKAVITGQQKDSNDNTTVVIERFRIRSTSVLVVAIDKVIDNPLSATAGSTTTKTSTSSTTFQPSTSTTVRTNTNTSTTSTSNLQLNTSMTTSTIAVITPPTTTSATLQPSTTTTSTSTSTTTATTTRTSPETSETKAISTTILTSVTTSIPATTTPASSNTLESNMTTTTPLTSLTTSMSTIQTSLGPSMISTSTSTSSTTSKSTTANTTSPNTPELKANSTTIFSSTSTSMPTTTSTTSPKTLEESSTPTTSTSPATPTTNTTSSTSLNTPEPTLTNTITLTSSTIPTPATVSTSLTNSQEPHTTATTSTSTTITKATTILTTSSKIPELSTTSFNTSTVSTTLSSTPASIMANTTAATTTTTANVTTPSISPTKLSEPSTTSTTTLTSTTSLKSTTNSSTSTKPPETNVTTMTTSTSTNTSIKSTNSTASPKTSESNMPSTTTSTTTISLQPTTNSTKSSSNTPTPIITTTTASSTTTAANVTTPNISSTKPPEPNMSSATTPTSTTSTTTSTPTISLRSTTVTITSPKSPEPSTTTATASTSIITSSKITNSTASPKPTEANMTSTTTSTTTISSKPTTNSTTLSNTPTSIVTTTTELKSTSASNMTTTSIFSSKPPESNTTITTTPTSTTSLTPATTSNITSTFPETNTTIATASTSTASSIITTYSTTSPKPTEATMTSARTSILTTTLKTDTTNITLTKIIELNTTVASTSTLTTLKPTTTSVMLPSTPEPNATNATTKTATYTTKPSSSVPTTMAATNISTVSTVSTNWTMVPSTISSSTIATTTTTTTGVAFNMKYYTAVVGAPLQLICVVSSWNGNLSISRSSRANQQEEKVVNMVNNETVTILNGFAVNRTFTGHNVNVSIFILNASCEDEGSYYCTSGAVSDNATVNRLPEKPTIKLPAIMIQDSYSDVHYPFVCEGEVENAGGMLIAEVNKNGTFYLYKAYGEIRKNNNTECGPKQIYTFYVDGRFTQDWDNAKIRCAAINNMTGVESGIRQISEEKTIRLISADICKAVTPGSKISYPYNDCELYLTCQSSGPVLGKCPQGVCFFDHVQACIRPTCPFVRCNDSEVVIGKTASVACDVLFCGASFSLTMMHSGETLFKETNISGQVFRNLSNIIIHILVRNGSAVINLTLLETKCNDSGDYAVDLSGYNVTDLAHVSLIVPKKMPSLTVPQSFVGCAEGTVYCNGELGDPYENMYLEVMFSGGYYAKYEQATLRVDKKECSNIGNLEMRFIASDKWNGAHVRCVTGNKNETRMESEVKLIRVTNSGLCFSSDEYRAYVNDTAELNCTATGLSPGNTIIFSRIKSTNDTEQIISTIELGKQPIYNISGIYINTLPLSANDSMFSLKINSLVCGDQGTYFCKVGSRQTSAGLILWRKPEKPTLTLATRMELDKYNLDADPFICKGNVGYPGGKLVIQIKRNGSFEDFTGYKQQTLPGEIKECGREETLTFFISGTFTQTWNNTDMRCIARNEVTLSESESAPFVQQTIFLVTDAICKGKANYARMPHPNYDCDRYIECISNSSVVRKCEEGKCFFTNINICAVDVSTTTLTTTTTATTTTRPPQCPSVRCNGAITNLNVNASIKCDILYCGESFTLSIVSKSVNQQTTISSNYTNITDNVGIYVYVQARTAVLNLTFHPVRCENKGTFTISIDNGNASNVVSLDVTVSHGIPVLAIPAAIYENQNTKVSCTGQLGYPESGTIYLEVMHRGGQYEKLTESLPVNISTSNCSNIGHLDIEFYTDSTWNESKIRCVTKGLYNMQIFMAEEKDIILMSPKIHFSPTSISGFIGSYMRLLCLVEDVINLQSVAIERETKLGGRELVSNISRNGTSISIQNKYGRIYINTSSFITAQSATVLMDFVSLDCFDTGTYYCIAGTFATKGTLSTFRKPTAPTLILPLGMFENFQFPYEVKCQGQVGYPAGKILLQTNKVGNFQNAPTLSVEDGNCSSIHTITVWQQFTSPWNNTIINCTVINNATLENGETPPSTETKILLVPEKICETTTAAYQVHPYNCTAYIWCYETGRNFLGCGPNQCANPIPNNSTPCVNTCGSCVSFAGR